MNITTNMAVKMIKNQINYSKVAVTFGEDLYNGKQTTTKYNGGATNTWINLDDYIFYITEESRDRLLIILVVLIIKTFF